MEKAASDPDRDHGLEILHLVQVPCLKNSETRTLFQRIERNITELKAARDFLKSLRILNVFVFPAIMLRIYFLYGLKK